MLNWNRLRYTFYAPIYDRIVNPFRSARARSIELLHPQPTDHLLILGAGTGSDLDYLPPVTTISAIDITPAMVQRIEKRAESLKMSVEARVMDGQALEYADHTFDAVILHLILAVIPDPYACIQEAARVLKPGGKMVIMDKWLPAHQQPSLIRSGANVLTAFLFSNINRQLEPLLKTVPVTLEHQEPLPAVFGKIGFKIALVRKNG